MKPMIVVISERYNEGLMQTWSTGIGTGTGPGQAAKPSGDWGYDGWEEPTASDTGW